jgi:hypothetical protein
VGLGLIAVFWSLNWGLTGLRTHLLFFPLWLGYVLAVDALAWRRRGTSIFARSRGGFAALFLRARLVWCFEVVNWRTQNWSYLGREQFSDLTYFLLASVAFSTVIPAVFETAEWVRSFGWMRRLKDGPRLRATPRSAPRWSSSAWRCWRCFSFGRRTSTRSSGAGCFSCSNR